MTELKAKPTEYKGIVFRSKSEAIFARALDLAGYEDWVYEPEYWPDYTPDFAISAPLQYGDDRLVLIVEYKPSTPTDTYLNALDRLDIPREADVFAVFIGNPWDEKSYRMWCQIKSGSKTARFSAGHIFERVKKYMPNARNHRFDLRD